MATQTKHDGPFKNAFSGTYAEFKNSKNVPMINWVETKSVNSWFAALEDGTYFIATTFLDELSNESDFYVYYVGNDKDHGPRYLCFPIEYAERKTRTI